MSENIDLGEQNNLDKYVVIPKKLGAKENSEARRMLEVGYALKDIFRDGETFLVQKDRGKIHISIPDPEKRKYSPIKELYPELYGHLLSMNQQISDASGCFTTCLFFLIAGFLSLSLHLNLLTKFFKTEVFIQFRSGWFYFIMIIFFSWCAFLLSELRERLAYRRGQKVLLEAITKSGISHALLLAQLEGDLHVDKVAELLKCYLPLNVQIFLP